MAIDRDDSGQTEFRPAPIIPPEWERRLRRLAVALLLALAALVAGALAVRPTLRAYHLWRLESTDPQTRLLAANALAEIASRDPSVVETLVDALACDGCSADPLIRLNSERILSWVVRNVDLGLPVVLGRLETADGEVFLLLASAVQRAGRWHEESVGLDLIIRRERIRLASEDASLRLLGASRLADLGPDACLRCVDSIETALDDVEDAVAAAAVDAAALLPIDESSRLFVAASRSDSAAVRRRVGEMIGLLGSTGDSEIVRSMLSDSDESVRCSAAWCVGQLRMRGFSGDLLAIIDGEVESSAGQMAVWSCGMVESDSRIVDRLSVLSEGGDEATRNRAFIAWARQGGSVVGIPSMLEEVAGIPSMLESVEGIPSMFESVAGIPSMLEEVARAESSAAVASLFTASASSFVGEDSERLLVLLRDELVDSLRKGEAERTVALVEAIAGRGDVGFAGVIDDIATTHGGSAMVRYAAARALESLDPGASADAMLLLMSCDSVVVRDLSAVALGRHGSQGVVSDLRFGLKSEDDYLRAACAFALGVRSKYRGDVSVDEVLDTLARRLDQEHQDWEPQELIRGYYLCSMLLLGEESVREDLDRFLLNRNFPRIAIYSTLLLSGERGVLDVILRDDGAIDSHSLLRDARFCDVLWPVLPDAPKFEWFEDRPFREYQMARLRDWWKLGRWLARFDRDSMAWRLE